MRKHRKNALSDLKSLEGLRAEMPRLKGDLAGIDVLLFINSLAKRRNKKRGKQLKSWSLKGKGMSVLSNLMCLRVKCLKQLELLMEELPLVLYLEEPKIHMSKKQSRE